MTASMEEIGRIQQQVVSLEQGYHEVREEVKSVRSEMSTGFSAILTKIDGKNTTKWQPIGILVSALLAIGGALYLPIREAASKQETMLETIRSQLVPRVEHERVWKEAAEEQRRAEERLRQLQQTQAKIAHDQAYLEGQLHPLSKP